MAWVMSVLGALLALGGGIALWRGSDYIRMDWGQAETVAGTVALSAGVVVIGLAAVLFKLRDLARVPARPAAPEAFAAAPEAPAAAGRLAAVGLPEPERVEPAPAIVPPPADLDQPFTGSHSLHDPAPRPEAPAAYDAPPRAVPAAPRPAASLEAPTVVGRYEANGASYVLFSDGTIEVETENGTHRFESMSHLKDHIEGQDAG